MLCQVTWKSVHWFRGRRVLKGFYHIWAGRPSWSCDPDAANSNHRDSTQNLALFGQAVSEKMFEYCGGRWSDAGAWVYYELTYEPSPQVS